MKKYFSFLIITVLTISVLSAQKTLSTGRNLTGAGNGFEPVEGQYVQINGINMYYEVYGEGSPILLIHDSGGSTRSMDNQIKFFSKKNKVIVADSRAQGNTNNNSDSLTYDMMAKDYKLLLDQLEVDSVWAIGQGDGANIALLMAIQYPEKIKTMVLAGAHLNCTTDAMEPAYVAQLQKQVSNYRDSIRAGKTQYKFTLELLNLQLHQPEIDLEQIQQITIPVFILNGDRDIVKPEHAVFIYRNLLDAQLDIIPGAGHNLMQEAPVLLNNGAMRFFMRNMKMQAKKEPINKTQEED